MIYNTGRLDSSVYPASIDRQQTKLYRLWAALLQRSLSPQYKARRPTYAGCQVDPRFHSYAGFCEWATQQPNFDRDGWQLDKDLLSKGGSVYAPECCVFLPAKVNSLLAVKYRKASGLPPGVRMARSGRFTAFYSVDGRQVTLGTFATLLEAETAYRAAKQAQLNAAVAPYVADLSPDVLQRLSVWFAR